MTNWAINLITNPSFETSDPPSSWTVAGSGAVFARSTEQVQSSTYSGKLTRVGNNCSISQSISANAYAGTTLVYGVWVWASVANVARIYLFDNVNGDTTSSYHTGSSTWEWLSITKTIDNNATSIACFLEARNTNTSVYFDDVVVFPGGLIPTETPDRSVVADGHISNVLIINGGSNYSEDTVVTISAPTRTVGITSTAIATPTIVNGVITEVALTNKGLGYEVDVHSNVANPYPIVTITDSGGGSGASAICYVPEGLPQSPWGNSLNAGFAIMQNGAAKAWGNNSGSHLGQGEGAINCVIPNYISYNNGSSSPVIPVRIIEMYNNTLILDSLGRVWGAGSNDEYELGLADATARAVFTMIPIARFGSSPVVKLKAGGASSSGFAYALTANGKCYRWGYNNQGQLGDGSTTNIQYPTELTNPSGIVDFSFMGGNSYTATMLLDTNGYVWVCGYNEYSNLSDGTTTDTETFQRYNTSAGVGLTGASRIWGGNADGSYITGWVLCSDGRLYGAGYNANNQLGEGTTTSTSSGTKYCTRVLRSDDSNFSADKLFFQAPSAGGSTCSCYARETSTGDIYGWGHNANGELGLGNTTSTTKATKITSLSPGTEGAGVTIIDFAVGHGANVSYTAILWSNGNIYVAGYNGYGQLGDGTATQRTSFVYANCPQKDAVKLKWMAEDGTASLQVLCLNGMLYTCGYNGYSDLGNGHTGTRYSLGKVLF